jgi:hypothetical protein
MEKVKHGTTRWQYQMSEKFAFLFLLAEHNPTFTQRHYEISIAFT